MPNNEQGGNHQPLGLIVYNPKTKIRREFTEKDGLSSNAINSFLEDNTGMIWIATDDGLTTFNGTSFTKIPITAITGTFVHTMTQHHPNYGVSLNPENAVNCVLQDSKGIFWIGLQKEIYRFNGQSYKQFTGNDGVKNNTGISFSTNGVGIESIVEDKSGGIWFGGRVIDGVFNYSNDSLQHFQTNGNNNDWIIPLTAKNDGEVWFVDRTLTMYSGKELKKTPKGSFADWTSTVVKDNDGNFWFGSGENWGVTKYDGKTFTNYTQKDCAFFSARNYIDIVMGNDGLLWFYGSKGQLGKFDGKRFLVELE